MEKVIRAIVQGSEFYFKSFSLADNMTHQEGDIEWVTPKPGERGPSLVYKISLDETNAAEAVRALIPAVKAGRVPSLWVVNPVSTPGGILDILYSCGFKDIGNNNRPEPGMAVNLSEWQAPASAPVKPEVHKVRSQREFAIWVDVVNEALHGWKMIDSQNYAKWLDHHEFAFYIAYFDGVPAATAATMQNEEIASLEFVSTLVSYRRRGAAAAVCTQALKESRSKNAKIVTLRSEYDAIPLYEKLGFKSYYEQNLLTYPK